jgi:hypothetical protein
MQLGESQLLKCCVTLSEFINPDFKEEKLLSSSVQMLYSSRNLAADGTSQKLSSQTCYRNRKTENL